MSLSSMSTHSESSDLASGETIIYEPGLNDLHTENLAAGRLSFDRCRDRHPES